MTMNFADALNVPVNEIERPPLIPVGTYRAQVSKVPSMDTISEDRWDVIDFNMRLVEPLEDVDQDELSKYGGLSPASVIRHRFMFSREDEAFFKRSLFNVRRFLQDHLKVDMNDSTSLKEALNGAVNHQCIVHVKWRADKNRPEELYNEISKTAPLT